MTATTLADPVRLGEWLGPRLPGSGPVQVRRHPEGHSNLTYVVSRAGTDGSGGSEWILRRPPAGPLLPTAHDVVREYHVLDLLARGDSSARAPRVIAVCEDPAVIGAPFYLMERVDGVVIREQPPDWLDGPARRDLGLDLAEALAEIHATPTEPFVAAGLGRPGGYLARQLHRWAGQREGIQQAVAAAGGRARELPDYDAVRDWLHAQLPEEAAPAVVHGDFKLDNVIVGHGEPRARARVAAVVDWEMATVGDPRADLGYLLSFWPEPGERFPLADLVTAAGGFPSRAELVATWEARTGREAGDVTWFTTLAVWKLAVLLEASYHRHLAGLTDDPFFATLEDGVPALLRHAREGCGA